MPCGNQIKGLIQIVCYSNLSRLNAITFREDGLMYPVIFFTTRILNLISSISLSHRKYN